MEHDGCVRNPSNENGAFAEARYVLEKVTWKSKAPICAKSGIFLNVHFTLQSHNVTERILIPWIQALPLHAMCFFRMCYQILICISRWQQKTTHPPLLFRSNARLWFLGVLWVDHRCVNHLRNKCKSVLKSTFCRYQYQVCLGIWSAFGFMQVMALEELACCYLLQTLHFCLLLTCEKVPAFIWS